MINYSDKNIGDQFTAVNANEIKDEHNALAPATIASKAHEAIFWDTLQRADSDPVDDSDSGNSYVNLVGDGAKIESNVLKLKSNNNITGFSYTRPTGIYNNTLRYSLFNGAAFVSGCVFAKDINNYIAIRVNQGGGRRFEIVHVLSGTPTQLFQSASLTDNIDYERLFLDYEVRIGVGSSSVTIHMWSSAGLAGGIDSSDADVFAVFDNISFVGLISSSSGASFNNILFI